MLYSISFTETDYSLLANTLLQDRLKERAAYLLCNYSESSSESRLLVKEIIFVSDSDINYSSEYGMSIKSVSYVKAIKQARLKKLVFVFVHSHPPGNIEHSKQDDIEEKKLFATIFQRIPDIKIHASLVISDFDKPVARVWHENGTCSNVDLIRVIGNRIKLFSHSSDELPFPQFFDRQVRVFGEEFQKTLRKLRVGIVGVGGTGSSVAEQLIRLGIGTIYIFDGESFEQSNINRVYGSRIKDEGNKKIKIISRLAKEINIGTTIVPFDKPITYESIARELRNCDIVFGCTDDNLGRSILCRLATYYYIPIFDMGVKIDSEDGIIKSIQGRVTTLYPNNACLFCRGRIKPAMIASESLELTNPSGAKELRREGYIPELPGTAPSVISFTTTIASTAINEFLNKLTGYMGSERESNEILQLFDTTVIKRNKQISKEDCFCGDPYFIGRGDKSKFLDLIWRKENE